MCAINPMKRQRDESLTNTPKRARNMMKAPPREINSHDYLMSISKNRVVRSTEIKNFFHTFTESELEAYGSTVTSAIRSRNLEQVERLHKEGQTFQCSNRFGESIIHMACRQGCYEVVNFLLKEAKVSLKIKDDYGRTPLHDAFWSATPNFELVNLLLEECPSLLFMTDKRGHAPLQYARVEHHSSWIKFLQERENLIRKGIEDLDEAIV